MPEYTLDGIPAFLYSPPCPPNRIHGCALCDVGDGLLLTRPHDACVPDTGNAEGGPVWKSLLPKPNRRMLPVKCPECSKLISNAYNLRVHMDLHKHLTYICSICSTPTRSRDTLRKHITNIHKVKGEDLRKMLDHGIVSSEAPSETVKQTAAAAAAAAATTTEDSKDDKEAVLVMVESGGEPSPAAAEPPLSASAAGATGTAGAAVTTC